MTQNLLTLFLCCLASASFSQAAKESAFKQRVIISGLADPWEVTYGPDDYLWITEAKGYTVSRINIATGIKSQILDLNKQRNFDSKTWPQGGLMGLALHPKLLSGKPFVYLAFVHQYLGAKGELGGKYFRTKIVRFTWDASKQSLNNPITMCDTIPGSNDHNGGRLLIASVEGEDYLFYSVGDMGAGQFDNVNRPNHAQDRNYYEGKILRFNTESDGDKDSIDQWIPNNNPFKNAVWSLGHRNPQGLASAVINRSFKLYSSEHGPYSDDEVNIIERAANYGHPLVIGYNDGNYNGLAASVSTHTTLPGKWNTSLPTIQTEAANAKKLGTLYRDPIKSFNPNSQQQLSKVFNAILSKSHKPDWPSIAPSSIAVYTSTAIPGWENSLLIPSLKMGKLFRLQLDHKGEKVLGKEEIVLESDNRYRDIAISPDGKNLYLITDKSAITSGPTKEDPQASAQRGAVIEYTYVKN
jgi:PQQ-dependent dehydrogenase (s-GDH family)